MKLHKPFSLPKLFIIAAITFVVASFLFDVWYGNTAVDIHLHDTYYFVLVHSFVPRAMAVAMLGFATVHGLFTLTKGTPMYRRPSLIHFWVTTCWCLVLLLPMPYQGVAGVPRRYFDFSPRNQLVEFLQQSPLIAIATAAGFFAQLLFLVTLVIGVFRKKEQSQ